MAEIARRAPEVVGELRVPLVVARQARAQLAAMVRRGEIAYAYNARTEGEGRRREWVVNYVRVREPRPRTPRLVALVCALLAAPAGLAGAIYHARHVLLAGLGVVAGALLAAAAVIALINFTTRRGGGHCPGAWHR